MSNCISKFVKPPEPEPTYLAVLKDKFPHYVSDVKVELDMGTGDHTSRAQVIPKCDVPDPDKPPDAPTGKYDPGNPDQKIPPSCTFAEVPYRDGKVPADQNMFRLAVWYHCGGSHWKVKSIQFTNSN